MDDRVILRKLILDWLDDRYLFGDAESLVRSDEMSFLENGILDSLGFVQLVLMLEDRYKIRIDRKHLTRANFDSMNKIVSYVATRAAFQA